MVRQSKEKLAEIQVKTINCFPNPLFPLSGAGAR